MKTKMLLTLTPLLFSMPAPASDGQTLLGSWDGFPITISQPGSYKLTENLTAPTNTQAILVTASNVVLDLGGFNVACSFVSPTVNINCVGDAGLGSPGVSDVTIRNGTVTHSQTGMSTAFIDVVGFEASSRTIVEDLHIEVTLSNFGGGIPPSLGFGANSIIRHNILSNRGEGAAYVREGCPSLIVENVKDGGPFSTSGTGCVYRNNVGPLM